MLLTVLLGFSVVVAFFIYSTYALELEDNTGLNKPYYYSITHQSKNPSLSTYDPEYLNVTLQNNGRMSWPVNQLFLNSSFFDGTLNYENPFATTRWIDGTNVRPAIEEGIASINPGEQITFNIPIMTNHKEGIYKVYFKPILKFQDNNILTLEGDVVEWLLVVGSELYYQNLGPEKQVLVSLDDQKLMAIENYVVVMETPVSTGKDGHNTPTGWYKILNHIDTAYSSPYRLYMDNWMALSSLTYGFKGYGLHKLPYWNVNPANYEGLEGQILDGRLYTQGRLYEDYNHLGERMSHGCVRLGLEAAQVLYDWAENGTLVKII